MVDLSITWPQNSQVILIGQTPGLINELKFKGYAGPADSQLSRVKKTYYLFFTHHKAYDSSPYKKKKGEQEQKPNKFI